MSEFLEINHLSKQFTARQTGWRSKQVVTAVSMMSSRFLT